MSEPVKCPAEGCDYMGPQPSVLGHFSGSHDDAHSGGYQEAKAAIEAAETGDESEPEQPDEGGQTNPVVDGPDPTPDAGGDTEAVCPECGSGRYFETPPSVDQPRACAECSDESGWVVYDV